MKGFQFSKFMSSDDGKTDFDRMLDIFMQLLSHTNGDANEALSWMTELDKEYKFSTPQYGLGDFMDELKEKGYVDEENDKGEIKITPKTEQWIRKRSLDEIFGKLKKTKKGNHITFKSGQGDELNSETRSFQFGDVLDQIDFVSSIRNSQINSGIEEFSLREDDL
jgi:hypothetical protein